MKKRNLDIAKKNLRSKKSKSYRRGTTTFTSPKIKSLRPKPTAIQATKNTIYQQKDNKKTSIAILYLCYLRTARHKM